MLNNGGFSCQLYLPLFYGLKYYKITHLIFEIYNIITLHKYLTQWQLSSELHLNVSVLNYVYSNFNILLLYINTVVFLFNLTISDRSV